MIKNYRKTHETKTSEAVCKDCPWNLTGRNSGGAAAMHAKTTGHATEYVRTVTSFFQGGHTDE